MPNAPTPVGRTPPTTGPSAPRRARVPGRATYLWLAPLLALSTALPAWSSPLTYAEPTGAAPATTRTSAAAWIDALRERRVLTAADRRAARDAIAPDAGSKDASARTLLGMALVERADGNLDAALDLARRAAAADPRDAEIQAWLGTATFESIGSSTAGAFAKADLASQGVDAYERALKLDPTTIDAHIGMAQFYLRAPALFGGSIRNAREHAETLLALPGGVGASYGHIILGQIAAYRGREEEMTRQFELAEAAADAESDQADHRRLIAINTAAWCWLLDRKNPARAIAQIDRCIAIAPEVGQHWFMLGEARRATKDWAAAAEAYRRALELQPGAPTARYELARCLDRLSDPAARQQWETFLADHPTDPRAGEARAALRRWSARR